MEEKVTFLDSTDFIRINEIKKRTEENVKKFEDIVESVVEKYSHDMDNIMKNVYNDIIRDVQPALSKVESYYLELSNCLYYMGEKLEKLGVYDSMSKQAYKEIYNQSYLNCSNPVDSKKKPTVAEITAIAENEALYEGVTNDIYNKAYKIVKNKVDAANTMLSCLSKVISRRMTEMQLSSTVPSGKKILNEDKYIDERYF